MTECRIKRALLSVSDKTGIVDFARRLADLGVEIVSTGGTLKALLDAGLSARYVAEVTQFPEMLDGRVKTLHPVIHGGILARRNDPLHRKALTEHNIATIDLVAVNLYPFQQTANRPDASWEELIENIDIGGPALLRSAAKNHEDVIVVVNPNDYKNVLRQLESEGDCPGKQRVCLALKAFEHTAEYDTCIHAALGRAASGSTDCEKFPELICQSVRKAADLRYGENPGQSAALYRDTSLPVSFIDSRQLQGKELSYNNWLDADSAFKIVQEFEEPAAVVVKHTNPCGAAVAETIEEAFQKAYGADPVSAYGGILAVNRPISQELAEALQGVFWEVVIAPVYSEGARSILERKTNLRLLEVPGKAWKLSPAWEWKSVQGGFLVQERNLQESPACTWKVVSVKIPSDAAIKDLEFAWKIVKHVKSNAIVLAKDRATLGIGAGQMNRVGAARIALSQAGKKTFGAVMASDAFFPFADTVRMAAKEGISAVIQPGGSLRDLESTEGADQHGIVMVHTGVRHFKH